MTFAVDWAFKTNDLSNSLMASSFTVLSLRLTKGSTTNLLLAEINRPPGRSPGLSKVPSFKHVVGWNIAVHAVSAYRASTYLVPAFPTHSTSFSPYFSYPQRRNVY